jgi:peptidoglycan/LPS O-acetylase OafA/YrhL
MPIATPAGKTDAAAPAVARGRYEFLDSLRGIAIAGVLLIHSSQMVPDLPARLQHFGAFGFRGVHLFFIVSALTLSLVMSQGTVPKALSLRSFYIRRFFRIAPMFYLAALAYLALRRAGVMDLAKVPVGPIDIASTFLFLHGLVPHAINNVVPGGWSIAAEALFYLLFPLLLPRVRDRRWMIGLLAVAVALALANWGLGRVIKGRIGSGYWDEFFSFNFAACLYAFATGMVLANLLLSGTLKPAATSRWQGNAVALAMLAAMTGFACFVAGVAQAQLLYLPLQFLLVLTAIRYQPALLVNRPLSFLGEISFSVYLVHFAVLRFAAPHVHAARPALHFALLYLATLAGSIVVATITHRLIEQPMIALGHRLSRRAAPALTAVTPSPYPQPQ